MNCFGLGTVCISMGFGLDLVTVGACWVWCIKTLKMLGGVIRGGLIQQTVWRMGCKMRGSQKLCRGGRGVA